MTPNRDRRPESENADRGFQKADAEALTGKLQKQEEFVRWWAETVGVRHGLNRHSIENADRGSLEKDEAEALTGISQQQVSRWRKKLQKREEFVRWWAETVSVRESPGGADRASSADLRSMVSKDDAESLTGISHQQVSRWRKRWPGGGRRR